MTVLEKLKTDLLYTIKYFEIKSGEKKEAISSAMAIHVVYLKEKISEVDSAIELQDCLLKRLKEMPGKFFSFLPFVNDLKRDLSRVLTQTEYQLERLLVDECLYLRMQNMTLKEENVQIKIKFNHFTESNYSEREAMLFEMTNENKNLKFQLKEQKLASAKAEEITLAEKDLLREQLTILDFKILTAFTETKKISQEKNMLYEANMKLLTLNQQLIDKVKFLEGLLQPSEHQHYSF